MLDSKLNEAQPLPQRQICRARMRTQTLRGTANHDRNRASRATLQDIRTRLLADAAYTHRQQDVAVERHLEVRRKGEQVGFEPREGFGEPGRLCAEGSQSSSRRSGV